MARPQETSLPLKPVAATDAGYRARRYTDRYPNANLAALEASVRVRRAAAALVGAYGRNLNALGMKSTARYTVLRELHFAPGATLTQLELGQLLDITSASVTYLIDCLEEDGLVVRNINPANRRVTHVALTEAGAALCRRLVPATAEFIGTLFEGHSEDEMAALNELLERLQARAELALLNEG